MVAMKENSETVEEETEGLQEERYVGLEVYFLRMTKSTSNIYRAHVN